MNNRVQPVKMTIDGEEFFADPDMTILQAAQKIGLYIPTLCHHPALSDRGGCRLCVVEVDGAPKLVASCVTPVRDGMTVVTSNDRILKNRRSILEFLFAERTHNCMFCPKSGDCELQHLAYELQMAHLTVPQSFREFPVDITSDAIGLDQNRCVLCGRCVRACEEIAGCYVLNFQNRGPETRIGFDIDEMCGESVCTSCGACVQVCPTGALYNRYRTYYAVGKKPEDFQTVRSVCPMCGLLCPTVSTVKENGLVKIEGLMPAQSDRPDGGQLCRVGRFEVLKNTHRRLLHPMVKKGDGSWVESSWENVLQVTAERLVAARNVHGGDSLLGLVSSMCSNEELVCFRDLMHGVRHDGVVTVLENAPFQNLYRVEYAENKSFKEASWKQIAQADYVLMVGSAEYGSRSVIGSMIRKRMLMSKIPAASIGLRNFLYPYGTLWARVDEGGEMKLLRAVLDRAVAGAGHQATAGRSHGSSMTGGKRRARESRSGQRLTEPEPEVLDEIAKGYVSSRNPLIIVGEDVAAQKGRDGLDPLVQLALLKGLTDGQALRLIVMKHGGNSLGAFKLLRLFEKKVASPPDVGPRSGLALLEAVSFREEPLRNVPDGFEFLAAITPVRCDRLEGRAQVLIPKPLWLEADGTYTALDGSSVAFRKKVLDPPAGVRAAWQTLTELAVRANVRVGYDSWEALRQTAESEIQRTVF